jgi:hypothetical protein
MVCEKAIEALLGVYSTTDGVVVLGRSDSQKERQSKESEVDLWAVRGKIFR